MEERKAQKEQQACNVLLENRKKISISGVVDVDTFDEGSFIAITQQGALRVTGADFHINKLNVDTGELVVEGEFDSCSFQDSYGGKQRGGMLARIFK